MKLSNTILAAFKNQSKLRLSGRDKRTSIESLLPNQTRVKAWEKTGEDKDTFFKRKHAHHHAFAKQKKQERLDEERYFNQSNKSSSSSSNDRYRGSTNNNYKNNRDRDRDSDKAPTENIHSSFFDYVYGLNSVRASILKRDSKNHNRLLYYNAIPKEIEELCETYKIGKCEVSSKDILNNLCKSSGVSSSSRASMGKIVHNNVVLETKKIEYPLINSLPDLSIEQDTESKDLSDKKKVVLIDGQEIECNNGEYPIGIYLDEIQDPHNMGAIIRSCYYLGIDFIVVSSRNCCSLHSPILHKSSCGAIEMVPIFTNVKPLKFLQDIKESNWLLISGQMKFENSRNKLNKKFIDIDDLKEIKTPKMLIVGNEGEGIRTNLLNLSDFFINVEPRKNIDLKIVDSLNVSVATALLINKLCK